MAIRLDTMLQAVQLPAGIADLAASLADVDGDALTLKIEETNLCRFIVKVLLLKFVLTNAY
jgi:hypothetical protein